MMMIPFFTVKIIEVPLIEGLCAQIYFRFEIIGGFAITFFAFLNRKKKMVEEKKQLVQDLIPPPSKNIHMSTLYTCMNSTCRDLVHLDSSAPPGVSSRPLGSHPSTLQCMCACIYTHIHTRTLPPVQTREDTDNTPISPSVKKNDNCEFGVFRSFCFLLLLLSLIFNKHSQIKNNPTRQVTRPSGLPEPPHPRPPTLNEQNAHT